MVFVSALALIVIGAFITLAAYLFGYADGHRSAQPPSPPNNERPQEVSA